MQGVIKRLVVQWNIFIEAVPEGIVVGNRV